MADIQKVTENENVGVPEKQENDRSYKQGNEESGLGTTAASDQTRESSDQNGTGASSGYDSMERSVKTSWEEYEGEVVSLTTFSLNFLQSSNVQKRLDECEISTIEHAEGTPRLRKGKFLET